MAGEGNDKSKNNHVTVQSRGHLVETVDRLLRNDRYLTSIAFGYDLCPFLLRDDFMETMVQILRSSTHLSHLGLYIGKQCKRFTLEGAATITDYIRTTKTLKVLSLEGDGIVSQKANKLINAAARNPCIHEMELYAFCINETSSIQDSAWTKLSFNGCAFDATGKEHKREFSVQSLKIRRTCEPSLIAWLVPRVTNISELEIALDTFPQTSIQGLCDILTRTTSLRRYHFHIGFSSASQIRICRNPNRVLRDHYYDYQDATIDQLLQVVHCLEYNSTIEDLSLAIPTSTYEIHQNNGNALASLKLHVQRNLSLRSLQLLSCPALTLSKKKELEKIRLENQNFLKQVATGVDDCPPSLWPFLIERCVKANSGRGLDVVFRRLADHRIALG